MWNICWTQHAQLSHGLEPNVFAFRGDVVPWTAFALSAVDDLVVNVGDVGDQSHIYAAIGEVSTQDVVHQGGSTMPKVGWPIHRGTTEVDADLPWLAHREGFHALGGGVIEVQHSDKPTI